MSSLPSPPSTIHTLSDLTALYHSSPTSASFLPSPASAATAAETHLPLLFQQRTLSLLRLRDALSCLETGRTEWAKEVDRLRREVEEEVRLESSLTAAGGGGKERKERTEEARRMKERREKTQKKVEEGYHALVSSFEREWGKADGLFQRWEVVLPLAPGGSSGGKADRLTSWVDGLSGGGSGVSGTEAVEDFLSLLLKEDPYILGSGIAMLSDLSALVTLSSPSSSPSSTSSSPAKTPLQTLFSFLSSASSPSALLELARGICETAVRELVGRERGAGGVSQPSTPSGEEGLEGVGLGINMSRSDGGGGAEKTGIYGRTKRGAREKELEELLVAVFEGLDRLGMATDGGEADSVPGPLAFTTRPMENLLLSFLSVGCSLLSTTPPSFASSTTSRSPSSPAPSSSPSSPSATWSPSTFLSHSLSTLASTPHLAYKTVTSVATLPGTAFNAFGLPTPPLSSLPSPASPKVPSSPESPNKPLPRIPPRSRAPTPSPPQAETPLDDLLNSTAASLLHLLTPSSSSSSTRPLADQLLHDLLSSSFPPVSSTVGASARTQEEEHRKVLSVGVVRWWAFQRLGAFLRSPQTAASPSLFRSSGVILPHQPDAPLPTPPVVGSRLSSSSFLSSVSITREVETGLLLPLHRLVYQAVTAACGLSGGERGWGEEGKGQGRMQETKGERELRRAAEAFVEGWRTRGSASLPDGKEVEKEKPQTVKVVPFIPSMLQALFTSTADVLLPELVPPSLCRSGGAKCSFKRGSSFGSGQDGWADRSGDEEEEEGGTTLRDRLEAVLAATTSREDDIALVYITSTAGQNGGRTVVSFTPPLPPTSSPAPALPPPTCLSPSDYSSLRRTLHTLLSSSTYAHICTASSSSSNDLLPALSSASSLGLSRGDYAHHAIFARATATLSRLTPTDRSDVSSSLLSSLSTPLLAAKARSSALIALSISSLSALATHHASHLFAGRAALSRLEQVRRRAWVAGVTASSLGKQLRARSREVREGSRTEAEEKLAAEEVERWKEDIGALSGFLPPDDSGQRDECLTLIELASALATEPSALAESGLFARETAVWVAAVGEGDGAAGEGQEGGKGLASTILGVPAALLGSIPLPPSPFAHLSPPYTPATTSFSPSTSSSARTGEADAGIFANSMEGRAVFDPQLGATTASLAADEGIGGGTGEAYLTDLASFLASSLLADLSSTLSSPDGPLVNLPSRGSTSTDNLLSLLLSPPSSASDALLPLDPRSGRPRVLTPTGPAPPAYVGALLRRFVEHPDLKEKLAALVEVEKVLVELLEADPRAEEGGKDTASAGEEGGRARRISFTTGDGGHLGPPLPGGGPSGGSYGSLRSSLRQRRARVSTSPSGLALERLWSQTSASASGTTTEPTSSLPSPLLANFAAPGASSQPPPPLALNGQGGTWRRHRRGLSLSSAASRASSGPGSPPPSPADLPFRPPAVGAVGDSVSTDALLGALENAILHFLPTLLPPTLSSPSPPSPASTFSSPPTKTPAHTPTYGLFTTLHLLAHLSPSLSSHTFSASSNALEAKAFSDLAVACLAIKGDLLDGKNGVVESAWAALGEGTEEGKEKARRLGEIAAREDAAGAKDLLVALS